jgi:hypothetical protein
LSATDGTAKALEDSPHPRLALRAIGCADVRYGILPSQSGYRFATAFAGLQTRTPKAARSASAMDGASIPG